MPVQIPIKESNYSARTLASQTGLSLSTVYRRQKQGYSALEIIREASVMKEHKSAGSNWKKVAKKEEKIEKKEAWSEVIEEKKPRKHLVHWEPADDYGEVTRLKVLGGWIVKIENEVLFVLDPKHRWEV